MSGWEAVLAAVGGLILGLGLGLVVARGREQRLVRRLRRTDAKLWTTILPVLASRADALGVARDVAQNTDPLEMAISLSVSIGRAEREPACAYSDTVALESHRLKRKSSE